MNKRRFLALLLVIAMAVLMFSACGEKEKPRSITADNLPKGKVLLSSLSQEELVKFLEERGVTVIRDREGGLPEFIAMFEETPDAPFAMAPERENIAKYFYEVHCAVCEYYGIENPYPDNYATRFDNVG